MATETLQVGKFGFELTLSVQTPMFPSAKAAVIPAAKLALEMLPRKLLTAKLKQAGSYALSIAVVDEKQIRTLNGNYRKKDKATDVLSFSRLEGEPTPFPEVGDIILGWEIVKAQAKAYGLSTREEIGRLTIHGVLHLFGYDHETNPEDAKRMFRLQNKIWRRFRLES